MRNSADMEFQLNAYDDTDFYTGDDNLDIMKVQRYIHYSQYGDTIYTLTTLYERKEEILTEKEKEYLSAVIRPFRNRLLNITKENYVDGDIISINLNHETIPLPFFKEGTMYKGMKIDKEYTLKELGL